MQTWSSGSTTSELESKRRERDTHFATAHEVSALVLVLLVDDDGVLPNGVIAFVGLPGLKLGNSSKFLLLLLLKVLFQSERVVFLLGLPVAAPAALSSLLALRRRSLFGRGRDGPFIRAASGRRTPSAGVSRGAESISSGVAFTRSLNFELSVAFIGTPALVNLLLGVTYCCSVRSYSMNKMLKRFAQFARLAVPVEGTPTAATAAAVTTTSAATAFATFDCGGITQRMS